MNVWYNVFAYGGFMNKNENLDKDKILKYRIIYVNE